MAVEWLVVASRSLPVASDVGRSPVKRHQGRRCHVLRCHNTPTRHYLLVQDICTLLPDGMGASSPCLSCPSLSPFPFSPVTLRSGEERERGGGEARSFNLALQKPQRCVIIRAPPSKRRRERYKYRNSFLLSTLYYVCSPSAPPPSSLLFFLAIFYPST